MFRSPKRTLDAFSPPRGLRLPLSASVATITLALIAPSIALADDASDALFTANNVWMMLSAALVFVMHLGFAMVESGLTRAKNTINILFKNTFIICCGILTYFLVGFNLMYPGEFNLISSGFLGFAGVGLSAGFAEGANTPGYADGGYTYWTDFLFQAMFAATAATIVSGAVAERIKLKSFMIFSTVFVAFVYTIAGSWKWGGGFLDAAGFYDFAGSTLVHSVGGWGALIGSLVLGARLGKYGEDGQVQPLPGSSMPLSTIGVFLLWLGWFGFNGGSVLSADPAATSFVLVTTCLAAAAGGIGAMIAYMFVSPKPDLSMALNGILAGLVGITAGADVINPTSAILVGMIAGMLVVGSVLFFDRIRIDDPVGAISVHLTCGIWGTLAVGIFSTNPEHSLLIQAYGVLCYAVFTTICAATLFLGLKATIGLRVSPEEELEGLDQSEHGMHAYDLSGTAGFGQDSGGSAFAEAGLTQAKLVGTEI
ncbi:MAG: ammonium transporter [Myxococcales bacterium]|nr:ammonium transporter [Myxococcales bacterium]HIK85664.1 ammonium transporter [Myxococcales bacterium]